MIVQFGGQTSISLAEPLARAGIKILGTSVEDIDKAEDRDKFLEFMTELGIPLPPGSTALSLEEAQSIAEKIGYPVLVRPSYVLGGRAMEIVYNDEELARYVEAALPASNGHPLLIDKYILGKEVEIDAVSDGEDVLIPGIMEHIERAGVHSGDSFAIYPPQNLSENTREKILDYTIKIAQKLKIKGLFNIQFVVDNDRLYVLEVNPRASRTVPILSKITGIPMVKLATRIMLGESLKGLGHTTGIHPESDFVTVKGPVFSFSKLISVDTLLGPEMKSTGEVMGTDKTYPKALKKSMMASGLTLPQGGKVLFAVAQGDKEPALEIARSLEEKGFEIYATNDTYEFFRSKGLTTHRVEKSHVLDLLKGGEIGLIINTPTLGKVISRFGFSLRRKAMEYNIPCLTSLDTARAMLDILEDTGPMEVFSLDQYNV